MDLREEVFVIHIIYLKAKKLIFSAYETQITLLIAKKVIVPAKYLDFLDVFFFKKLVAEMLKHFNINKHLIKTKSGKQLLYNLIYSLGPV